MALALHFKMAPELLFVKIFLATDNQQKISTSRGARPLRTMKEQMGVTDGLHCSKERIWSQFHSIIFLIPVSVNIVKETRHTLVLKYNIRQLFPKHQTQCTSQWHKHLLAKESV